MVKGLFWSDPNKSLVVLDGTDEAAKEYGVRCGFDLIELNPEHIEALQSGKMLAWNDSEYSTFVVLRTPENSH